MNLKDFQTRQRRIERLYNEGRDLLAMADHLENELLSDAGVVYVSREPGFACWTGKGVVGFYNTPEQVVEEMEKANVEKQS